MSSTSISSPSPMVSSTHRSASSPTSGIAPNSVERGCSGYNPQLQHQKHMPLRRSNNCGNSSNHRGVHSSSVLQAFLSFRPLSRSLLHPQTHSNMPLTVSFSTQVFLLAWTPLHHIPLLRNVCDRKFSIFKLISNRHQSSGRTLKAVEIMEMPVRGRKKTFSSIYELGC
jgi:hypothetical protein